MHKRLSSALISSILCSDNSSVGFFSCASARDDWSMMLTSLILWSPLLLISSVMRLIYSSLTKQNLNSLCDFVLLSSLLSIDFDYFYVDFNFDVRLLSDLRCFAKRLELYFDEFVFYWFDSFVLGVRSAWTSRLCSETYLRVSIPVVPVEIWL